MKLASPQFSAPERRRLRTRLLRWYDGNRRDLPWRRTSDPYAIWVSEIMLQQTRSAVVATYFQKFMRLFPDIATLSAADQAAVLASWSGLGYYRRARMLHAAAAQLVKEHGGELPREAPELRQLPGIGRYTAAAVASIAFGRREAAVDGNIERVLSRVLAPTTDRKLSRPEKGATARKRGAANTNATESIWRLAQELIAPQRPGDFNQAMMELGATICLPRDPLCDRCPVYKWCALRAANPGRRGAPKRVRKVAYGLSTMGDQVLLARRPAQARMMPAMWELPAFEPGDLINNRRRQPPLLSLNHSITNTVYRVSVYTMRASEMRKNLTAGDTQAAWVSPDRLRMLPLTGLARKVLMRLAIF